MNSILEQFNLKFEKFIEKMNFLDKKRKRIDFEKLEKDAKELDDHGSLKL